MKIAYISDAVYPYNKGGKEKRIYEILRRLTKYGHQICVYTMNWWRGQRVKKEDGLMLYGVCKVKKLYTKKRRSIYQAIYFGIRVFFPLLKADFDLLVADNVPYFQLFFIKIISLFKNRPLIFDWLEVWTRSYWQSYLGKTKGSLAYLVELAAAKLPCKIISISELTTRNLISKLGVPEEKVITIPCGIDFDGIVRIKENPTYRSDLIFAGRLLFHKNVDVLIKATKIIKKKFDLNIQCIIIGDGPEKKNLMETAKVLNLERNIKFLGFIEDQNKVYSYFKSSKIFVFPTTREGFGIACLEANACGLPVITIDHENNAAKDLVKNDVNGYLCSLDDKEIAKVAIRILKDRYLQQKLSGGSIEFARQYSWDRITRDVNREYLRFEKKIP